jgi:hypothetical protein
MAFFGADIPFRLIGMRFAWQWMGQENCQERLDVDWSTVCND